MPFDGTKVELAVRLATGLGLDLWSGLPAYFNANAAADAGFATPAAILDWEAETATESYITLDSVSGLFGAAGLPDYLPEVGEPVRVFNIPGMGADGAEWRVRAVAQDTFTLLTLVGTVVGSPPGPGGPMDPSPGVSALGPKHLAARVIVSALADRLKGLSATATSDLLGSLLTSATATWRIAGVGPQEGHRTLMAGQAALIATNVDAYLNAWLEAREATITAAKAAATLT
jgi:hypothetical protein